MTGPVVEAAAIVMAGATTATAGAAVATYRLVKEHDRTLYGAERVDEWDGLVHEVERNSTALEREDLR